MKRRFLCSGEAFSCPRFLCENLMFRNDFGCCATKAVLPVAMLFVLALHGQAIAQVVGYTEQSIPPTVIYQDQNYTSQYVPVESFPTANSSSTISYATPDYVLPQATYTSSVPAPTYSAPVNSSPNYSTSGSGLAQSKAARAARIGLRGHLGGGLGGARYEGVGWSNRSAQDAIENCCYWGTRPTMQIGVSKGQDGCWYACVLYR